VPPDQHQSTRDPTRRISRLSPTSRHVQCRLRIDISSAIQSGCVGSTRFSNSLPVGLSFRSSYSSLSYVLSVCRMHSPASHVYADIEISLYESLCTAKKNFKQYFTARRVCTARTMPWQDVSMSVCSSVTRRYTV